MFFIEDDVDTFLAHFGVKGMRWGQRKADDSVGITKRDTKWVKKRSDKITDKAYKKSSRELGKYQKQLMKDPNAVNKSGNLSSATILAYNQKMAEVMSTKVSDLASPSGKTLAFVAKRGEVGVFLAITDKGYDTSQIKNGLFDNGREGYKKTAIKKI